MTRDDIDRLIDATQAQADQSDPGAVPGAIYLNSKTWIALPMAAFPTTCTSPGRGIRYRGLRVLISSQFADKVATRAECGEAGEPFEGLEQRAAD
jgi:hypothetical protein